MTRVIKGKSGWNAENIDDRQAAALRIFGALSGVDEDYLAVCEESGTAVSPMARFVWKYGKAMAAALCVAVLGVSYLSFRIGVFPGGTKSGDLNDSISINTEADCAAPDQAEGVCEAEEAPAAAAAYAYDVYEETAEEGYEDMPAGMASDADSGAAVTESRKEAGLSVEKAEADDGKQMSAEDFAGKISGNLQDSRREMTLEAAGELAVVGAYLPSFWPSDGRIGEVRGSDMEGAESIALTWTYGNQWDSFFVTVTNLGNTLPAWVQDAIADVSKPECYDRRLYTIPYADSVPEEYLAVFQDPVFQREDFSRACVEARILPNAGDSGDSDTPRGSFRVLYQTEDGQYVLVSFNGNGSVDEVWSMINSVNYFAQYEEWMKPPAP